MPLKQKQKISDVIKSLDSVALYKTDSRLHFRERNNHAIKKVCFLYSWDSFKKANIILSRLRNSLMTLILASRVQNVEIHIRFDGINCIFFIVHI